jgi:glycosyltransferase involved in cell wall biosynthesis
LNIAAATMEQSPVKVSVVVPCFNSEATLCETAQSVLVQTLRDFEIVFVDDGSTDATRALIERIIGENVHTRMRLVAHANGGPAAARNCGIAAAQGVYILPLDADDLIAPTMLERCAAVLDDAPEVDLVYTDREDFGDISGVRTAGTYAIERLKYFNQIGYCSMYRRSLWQAIGGYRANVSGFDDWDFWLAAALRGCCARHVPESLFKHRRRRDSLLWRLLPRFERLHAQIILNNRDAYTEREAEAAESFLQRGEAAPMLQSARFLFLARYFEGYALPLERSCG